MTETETKEYAVVYPLVCTHENGILKLTLPKTEKILLKKITIN